jgi:SSS family solute:Na+ symporter/sodium/pantothenate symporter
VSENLLSWIFVLAYAAVIVAVAWYNSRKAKTMQSFSVGTRDVQPWFIGLSLAANMTSIATFVINPGLVYAYGFAGFVGYALATPLGIFLGLIVVTKKFRRIADKHSTITVPQWIGSRYNDKAITIYFSLVSLLQITFLVLITVGTTVVLMKVLGISMIAALLAITLFTFTYIIVGGASAHIWTNTIQAIIKLIVAVILLASGAELLRGGFGPFFERLAAVAPHYAETANPDSKLFRDFLEVVVANFIIGIAIITQPHIMSKSLFLRSEKDVTQYLTTAIIAEVVFFALLFVGLFARLYLNDPALPPDRVMSTYIFERFSPLLRAVVTLGILSAGFSTLEGILLSLSTIFSNDFYKNVVPMKHLTDADAKQRLLRVSRIFLVVLAPVTIILSYQQIVNPSLSVAIFGQNGVYGLFSASFVPILFGIFSKNITRNTVFLASASALVVHFGMYYGNITMYHNNPAVTAAAALVVSTTIALIGTLVARRRNQHDPHQLV